MRVRWLRLAAIICAVVAAICCFVLPAAALDATYTFTDEIPIRISRGDCKINMKDVLEGLMR